MMRIVSLLALLLLPCAAHAQIVQFSGAAPGVQSCQQGTSYVDGCAGAPTGSPQLPSLFSAYTIRPPWNVAGVDYAAGVPSNITLQDVATATLPSGATYSSAAATLTLSGSGGTISGIDFTGHGGVEVLVQASGWTIKNSHFKVSTNGGSAGSACPSTSFCGTMLYGNSSAGNLTIENCEFDGNNIAVTSQQGTALAYAGTGTLTMMYNYFHNSGGDLFDAIGGGPSTFVVEYNIFSNNGTQTAHADNLQWYGTEIASATIGFNTVYSNTTGQDGEGLFAVPNGGTGSYIDNVTMRNNTVLAPQAITNAAMGNFAIGLEEDNASSATGNVVRDNYIDWTSQKTFTGAWLLPVNYYPTYWGPNGALSNNIDIKTNTVLLPSANQSPYMAFPDAGGATPASSDVLSVAASPATGNVTTGNTITFTLSLDDAYTVTGSPTLSLSSGGTATYSSGNGTNSLVFSYTVGSGDSATNLAITAFNATAGGATIKDAVGNAIVGSGALVTFASLDVNSAVASTCPQGTSYVSVGDGCQGAQSSGSVQVANLFTTHTGTNFSAHRPPWNVAGVDYAVGYSGTLADPTGGTLPACASISGSGSGPYSVTVANSGGGTCTISHFDFSLYNAMCISVTANTGTVIFDNDKIAEGTNCHPNGGPVLNVAGTAPVTVQYTEIDGSQTDGNVEGMIQSGAANYNLTVKYSAFLHFDQAGIQLNQSGTFLDEYNYVEGIGCCGNHGDYVIGNATSGSGTQKSNWNTIYQGASNTATANAYITNANGTGATLTEADWTYNTLVGSQTAPSGYLVNLESSGTVQTVNVNNNYMELLQSYGFADTTSGGGTISGPITCTGNIDMSTGGNASFSLNGTTCN